MASYTYPSTQSNNGANSYIKIEEISIARDTMRLVISNQLIADGYPQENLDIKAFYDLDRDELTRYLEELIHYQFGKQVIHIVKIFSSNSVREIFHIFY